MHSMYLSSSGYLVLSGFGKMISLECTWLYLVFFMQLYLCFTEKKALFFVFLSLVRVNYSFLFFLSAGLQC